MDDKIIEKFYEKLVKYLPMDNAEFRASLKTAGLFPGDLKSAITSKSTRAKMAEYFLDNGINNDIGNFTKLLTVMKNSKCDRLKLLVNEIQRRSAPSIAETESAPVEFSADQKMEDAYAQLFMKFVSEFSRPPPYGPSFIAVKGLFINYCELHHHEHCDSTTSVFSMDDLLSKLANPVYCNFLNLGLLECLANGVDNKCLKTSIRNYDETFCNVQIENELDSFVRFKEKVVRSEESESQAKEYEVIFMKLIRKGITYGQIKQIKVHISHNELQILPNSLTFEWYGKGSVCLGWLIPSCLVDAAYHSACTNTAVLTQLGMKYLIIGNYKIKPPALANRTILETPMELFCRYYQDLIQGLQPVKVSEYMHSKGLLNKKDCTVILNAPCDQIRNRLIIEHVRHHSSSYLFTFLDVLQKTQDQRYFDHLYHMLLNALQFAGFLSLPDDYMYDITLDDDDDHDDDGQMDHSSFHPSLDQYVKDCLKMNLSVKYKIKPLLPDCKEPKESDVNIYYLYLIDNLCKLMESCDPRVFIDKCSSLMASYNYNITLYSDEILKEFGEYHNVPVMLRHLMCYCTWCDLSVVLKLLEICDCPDGVRLLHNFKHMIDFTKPITEYPISNPDSLMISSASSPYTVMVTKYELVYSPLSLKHIEVIKSLITEKCEITFISCQFLATTNDSQVFHWLIPKSVVPLIMDRVQEHSSYLHKSGIKELYIYSCTTGKLLTIPLPTYSNIQMTSQQELDEMTLKYNLLYEENADLKSQLDIMHKESKENRKLIDKYMELKFEKQHHAAVGTDLIADKSLEQFSDHSNSLAGVSNNSDSELHIYECTMQPFNADANDPPSNVVASSPSTQLDAFLSDVSSLGRSPSSVPPPPSVPGMPSSPANSKANMSYNYQAQKPGEGNLGSKEHLMDLDNSLIPSKQQLQSQNDIVISRNPSNSFSGANPDSSVMETSSSDGMAPGSHMSPALHKTSSARLLIKSEGKMPKKEFSPEDLHDALSPVLHMLYDQIPECLPFIQPVDPNLLQIPDYYIIKKPIDLSIISTRLEEGFYKTPWEFCEDIWLMFDNCWMYNKKNTRVYKMGLKLSEVFDMYIDDAMKKLGYCCGRQYSFSPQVLYCYSRNVCPISRDATYWSYQNRYVYCTKCFSEIQGDMITIGNDSKNCNKIKKSLFVEMKNDTIEMEPMVSCVCCGRKMHQICVLYFEPLCQEGFHCHICMKKLSLPKRENKFSAKRLPTTRLGTFLEDRVNTFLRNNGVTTGEVTIRMVLNTDKVLETRSGMKNRFPTEFPVQFPYKAKVMFVFQECDGVDICIFGMHVQEYGSECPAPNSRCVYISYLDSVHYFQPRSYRTQVYHEIIIGYLEHVRNLGYYTAHIWACPPSEGDDYIYHCHPPEQKIPKPRRLQEWCCKMIEEAKADGVVNVWKDMHQQSCDDELTSVTELAYFEGDFWPSVIEEQIKELDREEKTQVSGEGRRSKKATNKKATSKKGWGSCSKNSKKAVISAGSCDLSQRIFSIMEKHKEAFFVIYLQDPSISPSTLMSTVDPDPVMVCDLMEGRDSFLIMAQERYLKFSSLRRVKYSTMVMLYELHNQGSGFVYTCNACSMHVETRYHCSECEDFDLCVACYHEKGHGHKMEKLGLGLSLEDNNQTKPQMPQNPHEARKQSIQKCIQSLVHAYQCRDMTCKLENCIKMKRVIRHTRDCILRNNRNCSICRQFVTLCLFHARNCNKNQCSVSLCSNIKQKLKEQQIEHQIHQDCLIMRRMVEMRLHSEALTPTTHIAPSAPSISDEYSANTNLSDCEKAFNNLTEVFVQEFSECDDICITSIGQWCKSYWDDESLNLNVSSAKELFASLKSSSYYTFLNTRLLKCLANKSGKESLRESVKRYEEQISGLKLQDIPRKVNVIGDNLSKEDVELISLLLQDEVTLRQLQHICIPRWLDNETLTLDCGTHLPEFYTLFKDDKNFLAKAKKENQVIDFQHIKILLTGSAAVGKTSFCHLLFGSKFFNDYESTEIMETKQAISIMSFCRLEQKSREKDKEVIWLKLDPKNQRAHFKSLLKCRMFHQNELEINQEMLTIDKDMSTTNITDESILNTSKLSATKNINAYTTDTSENINTNTNDASEDMETNISDTSESMDTSTKHTSKNVDTKSNDKTGKINTTGNINAKSNDTSENVDESTVFTKHEPQTDVENKILSNDPLDENFKINQNEAIKLITVIDTGGQPQYIHMLPTINNCPTFNFVVHDMTKDLDDPVIVQHKSKHNKNFTDYSLHYSNLDMIGLLMSLTTDSLEQPTKQTPTKTRVSVPNKSFIGFVGTHKDKLEEKSCAEKIATINDRLTCMVKERKCEFAVMPGENGILFPVDNTTAGSGDKEDIVVKKLRQKIEDSMNRLTNKCLPITWMILELELQELHEDCGTKYVTCEEYTTIATERASIFPEEVEESLQYFDFLGVFLHFRNVDGLCDYVIIDHQWLFDNLAMIMHLSPHDINFQDYKFENQFREKRLLAKGELCIINWSDNLRPEYFFNLLIHLKVIATVVLDGEEYYYMPCVLSSTIQYSDRIKFLYNEPLLVQFSSGFLPRGFFCSLVVHLLQNLPTGWDHQLHNTKHFRNVITFRLPDKSFLCLYDKTSYLEVQIRHHTGNLYNSYHSKVFPVLCQYFKDVCHKLNFNLEKLQYGFLCHNSKNNDDHIAVIKPFKLPLPCELECCRKCPCATKLEECHSIWFKEIAGEAGDDLYLNATSQSVQGITAHTQIQQQTMGNTDNVTSQSWQCSTAHTQVQQTARSTDIPEMAEIIKIVVPRIQAEWEKVAYILRYSIPAVKAIKENHQNLEKCCLNLFADWLSTDHGAGPKTWSTLIKKLREVEDLAAATNEIIDELKSHNIYIAI